MGNILFHLQFPTPPEWNSLVFESFFESLDGWYNQIWNSAVVTLSQNHVLLHTAAQASSKALIMKTPYYPIGTVTWTKPRTLKTKLRAKNYTNAGELLRAFTGGYDTPIGFGFTFDGNKLYGRTANGSLANLVQLEVIPAGAYDVTRNLRAEFTPGSRVDFYVDEVLKGTSTTRLPTGDDGALIFAHIECTSIDAFQRDLYVTQFKLTQEI